MKHTPQDDALDLGQTKKVKKENWKKLLTFKGTRQDWILFVIMLLVLFMAWAYVEETTRLREVISIYTNSCIIWKDGFLLGYCGDAQCDRRGDRGAIESEQNCPVDCATETYGVNITIPNG